MQNAKEIVFKADGVKSLVWSDDHLIDWVAGGTQYDLTGNTTAASVRYAYSFDAAVSSPSGEYAVIYTKLGTKGLVLRNGEIVREINRSFYHADVYEYPIALFRLKSGQEVIAHCPEAYCRIEIDDLETGVRLTEAEDRKPKDFFHSRLNVSGNGQYLLSAGWIWHPVNAVLVFDIDLALREPSHMDGEGLVRTIWAEDGANAIFLPENRLAVTLTGLEHDDGEDTSIPRPPELRIYDLAHGDTPAARHPAALTGTMMAVGTGHFLDLHRHPKLFEMTTGRIVHEWPHIHSGTQVSSIVINGPLAPPIALDPTRSRCAIASEGQIFVLQFEN